jgi:hypothetical protein
MMGSVVLLRGVISGLGHEVHCAVLAWKAVTHSAQGIARFKVVEAPRHLPDGAYTVTFDGRAFPTSKEAGWWAMESVA